MYTNNNFFIGCLISGPLDKVFINFVDHGGPGLLCFPNDFLFADQLNDALNTMYDNGAYRKVIYCKNYNVYYII